MSILFFAATLPALADPVCLEPETYVQVLLKLEELRVLETTSPVVEIYERFTIVVDEDGRTYLNAAEEQPLDGHVSWGHLSAELSLVVSSTVTELEPPKWGFRYRPKASLIALPLNVSPQTSLSGAYDVGLSADVFYIQRYNLNASVGVRSIGLSLGYDVFLNSGVSLGARYLYPWSNVGSLPVQPSLEWYFAF